MKTLILNYLLVSPLFTYLVILGGSLIEGDVTLFTSAFLLSQGYLNIPLVFLTTVLGVAISDLAWYFFGRKIDQGTLVFRWLMKIVKPLDRHFDERTFRTIVISKFAYGMGHLTSMKAGSKGMTFKSFLKLNFSATLIWYAVLASLGYISGASFELLKGYIKYTELAILVGIVLLFLLEKLVEWRVEARDRAETG